MTVVGVRFRYQGEVIVPHSKVIRLGFGYAARAVHSVSFLTFYGRLARYWRRNQSQLFAMKQHLYDKRNAQSEVAVH